MQEVEETQVRALGWEDPLEKEMATHSSISCLENSMNRGTWRATVHGVAKSQMWLSAAQKQQQTLVYKPLCGPEEGQDGAL